MTYEEVVEKISNIRRFGNLTGVEIMGRILTALDHPQTGMRVIHIAGTNGKGSVSAFLCEILREAGCNVGMFTSPHLVDFRERITVNGEMIPKERVRDLGEALLTADFGVQPTMFDLCLAMALLYFKERQCDVVILETGLGGRCDSTNAVGIPDVSVITKIGFDHMAILGNTLGEIAAEKAGIIKHGTALILESQETEALLPLLAAAEREEIGDFRIVDTKQIRNTGYRGGMQQFSYGAYEGLCMQMLGVHQYENAAAALLAAEAFFARAEELSPGEERIKSSIYRGIAHTRWQGRMEILSEDPFLLVDGAHNSNGVCALRDSLAALFPGEKFHFVMGVMADKDYEEMIGLLLPLAIDFTTCTVESERALAAKELASCIEKRGIRAVAAADYRACFAPEKLSREHKTVAFGSLYFIGEIEALF